MVCDIFYSGTKLVIYAWYVLCYVNFTNLNMKQMHYRLVEKVYVVTSTRQTRWKTISYRIHVLLMMPYIVILSLMVISDHWFIV
jgi:hypothetical protein